MYSRAGPLPPGPPDFLPALVTNRQGGMLFAKSPDAPIFGLSSLFPACLSLFSFLSANQVQIELCIIVAYFFALVEYFSYLIYRASAKNQCKRSALFPKILQFSLFFSSERPFFPFLLGALFFFVNIAQVTRLLFSKPISAIIRPVQFQKALQRGPCIKPFQTLWCFLLSGSGEHRFAQSASFILVKYF